MARLLLAAAADHAQSLVAAAIDAPRPLGHNGSGATALSSFPTAHGRLPWAAARQLAAAAAAVAPSPPASYEPVAPQPSGDRRALKLPPHVYLVSFITLLLVMALLLLCHCYRLVFIARRMQQHAAEAGEPGAPFSRGAASWSGRNKGSSTPQAVIDALPVRRFSLVQGYGGAGGGAGCACGAGGGHSVCSADDGGGGGSGGAGARPGMVGAPAAEGAAAAAGAPGPGSCLAAAAGAPATPARASSCASGAEPCCICMDEFGSADEVMLLPCRHWFHPSCITQWLLRNSTCPLCKMSVLPLACAGAGCSVAPDGAAWPPALASHGSGSMAPARLQVVGRPGAPAGAGARGLLPWLASVAVRGRREPAAGAAPGAAAAGEHAAAAAGDARPAGVEGVGGAGGQRWRPRLEALLLLPPEVPQGPRLGHGSHLSSAAAALQRL